MGGERIPARPPPPPATLPALGNWADRGRPSVGLRHAPSASALFAFKSPELGEGRIEGNPGRGPDWTLCFGVNRSSASVSLCPGGPGQWKLIQTACPGRSTGAIPELGRLIRPRESAAGAGPAPVALAVQEGTPDAPHQALTSPRPRLKAPPGRSLMRPEICPAVPQPEGWCLLGGCAWNRMKPGFFTRPSHSTSCLPSWATKGTREAGGPSSSRPHFSPVIWNGVLGSARLLSALGEGRGWTATPAGLMHRVLPGGLFLPSAPLTGSSPLGWLEPQQGQVLIA